MSKPHLLVIGPFPDADLQPLERDFTVHKYWLAEDRDAFVAERADLIRGIATRGDRGAWRSLIEALPNLEMIANYGVGFDAVDIDCARERGVRVTNTPDVLTEDVADFGFALLLAVARQIPRGDGHVRSGKWSKGPMPLGARLFGKRLGIVGLGRIGSAVARRAAAFDMSIAYHDLARRDDLPYRYVDDLVALARESDFLIVTVAGGAGSAKIVNADVLNALGPSGFLVNISRGSTVDQAALLDALENGKIAGAALDVFEIEPVNDPRFNALENVVLQPHQASATVETRQAMGQLMRDNLAAHFAGRPLLTPVV
ncbi:MAG: 2-hydroxyacid dehydrogenase [Pseudomonadota bacterium]